MSAAECIRWLEADHEWGCWSQPYSVAGRQEMWQERRCQCGNRDFRPVPALSGELRR